MVADAEWGLDTNVLVRYLVADDGRQHAISRKLIEDEHSVTSPLLVHPVMLAELVWVLRSRFKASRDDLARTLDLILRTDVFRVLNEQIVREALDLFRSFDVDFADALLHAEYRQAGASGLITFDRSAGDLPGARTLDREAEPN